MPHLASPGQALPRRSAGESCGLIPPKSLRASLTEATEGTETGASAAVALGVGHLAPGLDAAGGGEPVTRTGGAPVKAVGFAPIDVHVRPVKNVGFNATVVMQFCLASYGGSGCLVDDLAHLRGVESP